MQKFSVFFVKQWQFTLVLFAMLIALGFYSVTSIPRSEDPQFPMPVMLIKAILPGADPVDMERLIADPIEDALDALDDVKDIRSTSQNGVTVIAVEFTWDSDPAKKYDDVLREVNALRGSLPRGLSRLEVERLRTIDASIVQIALQSDTLAWPVFEELCRNLKDELDRVPGVESAQCWGIPKTELRVAADLAKLSQLNIPLSQIANAVSESGRNIPPGAVHSGDRRFNISASGGFSSLESVGDTVVLAANGKTVRVSDLAKVTWSSDEADHLTRINGKRAAFLTVTQKNGEDVFDVRERVWAALDDFERRLPEGVAMLRPFDQSKSVETRLNHLFFDFAIALGLVLLTLLPLGFRASLIVMISVPLSLSIGVSLLLFNGYSLNQLSIAGFVLALGLLVDDSIVVTENIARHLRSGVPRRRAAMDATSQITVAVLGCTVALVLAFLPLLFLPEGAGKFTRSLPASILFTVAASLFVALTIIPFLASRILSEREGPEGNRVLQSVQWLIRSFYNPILHHALLRPWQTLAITAGIVLLSLPLIPIIGFSLFPPASSPYFLVQIEMPDGTALSKTNNVLNQVEAVLARTPGVKWYLSNLGHGNPQVYYNVRSHESAANFAEVFVSLGKWEDRSGNELLRSLRKQLRSIPGAQIFVREFANGPPIEAPIAVRISGADISTLRELASDVARRMETVAGVRDVLNPVRLLRTDLDLGIDANKAAALGVPAGAIDQTIRIALEGQVLSEFRSGNSRTFDIVLRLPVTERNDLDALSLIYLPTSSGGSIPLGLVTSPAFKGGPSRIDRYGRQRVVTVTAQVQKGFVTSKVTQDVMTRLSDVKLPPGYAFSSGGEAEAQRRSFGGLWVAMVLALLAILAALVLEFRSFKATAVVAAVIPLGILGGVFALWLTGYTLSFTAVIGFIALVGIEIKNSILLVDFTVQLQRKGVRLRQAIEQAGEIRFLPVLLTSATAIGGLLPLALEGSGLYSPLAIVIIGGLITSTLLSRIVTPVMYLLLAPRGRANEYQTLNAAPAAPSH